MAMRAGYRGENMFLECRPRRLAAITYDPLASVDLRSYTSDDPPPGWDSLAPSQKGSISKFAWQIRAGDTLYVKDSARPNRLVARGRVLGRPGERAYRFNKGSPIRTREGVVWRHLIGVAWEDDFQEIEYKDHSANTTVLRIADDESTRLMRVAKRAKTTARSEVKTYLERAYPRATQATIQNILPRHKTLSRYFQEWLWNEYGIEGLPERQWIDMQFILGQDSAMAEFKIAYGGNTTAAIREALGQILEYNHYPKRKVKQRWFLVLDRPARPQDCVFVDALRKRLRLPLHLGWRNKTNFLFYPTSPF